MHKFCREKNWILASYQISQEPILKVVAQSAPKAVLLNTCFDQVKLNEIDSVITKVKGKRMVK